jgi:hypothetical protein
VGRRVRSIRVRSAVIIHFVENGVKFVERGQAEGALRKRVVRCQAAACSAQTHGMPCSLRGLLLPDKVGPNALGAALTPSLEGLEN